MLNLSELIQSKKVLMCGGKGGVGKTTLSCAIAIKAALVGKKVLLISTDPAHSLSDAFAIQIGNKEKTIAESLTVLELDPDTEVDAYLERVLRHMRRYVKPDQVRELERQFSLTRMSPGAQEAAILERICRLLDEGLEQYDLLVFDTAPTGHTLRLLSLPEAMAVWTEGLLKHNKRSQELSSVLDHLTPGRSINNPMNDPAKNPIENLDDRQQKLLSTLLERQRLFHRARHILKDEALTGFIFVLNPERLPILETQRAVSSLHESHITVSGLLINRVIPQNSVTDGFWASRLAQQEHYLELIDNEFSDLQTQRIPLQQQDVQGLERLTEIAQNLE